LRARVKGFEKPMLDELLYKDRVLLDYFDKNLSIIQTADWPYFRRYRQAYQNNIKSLDAVNAVCGKIKDIILERGAVSSSDIGFDGAVRRCLALTTNGKYTRPKSAANTAVTQYRYCMATAL
jgi:uncharacterized protein YcaQ